MDLPRRHAFFHAELIFVNHLGVRCEVSVSLVRVK